MIAVAAGPFRRHGTPALAGPEVASQTPGGAAPSKASTTPTNRFERTNRMAKYSKDYQPTEARDEHGDKVDTFESPFLAKAREEWETNRGTTNGNWTFTPVDES